MSKFQMPNEYERAHKHSENNKREILASKKCGCFYCSKIFDAIEVMEYVGYENDTALCPYCSINSVIGDKSEILLTKKFLKAMCKKWFSVPK